MGEDQYRKWVEDNFSSPVKEKLFDIYKESLYQPEKPTPEDNAARIAKTTTFLRSIERKHFEGSDTRSIEINFRSVSGTYSGERYLMAILLPDFFFHVATAHDILRQRGLAIGKADYLGRVTP